MTILTDDDRFVLERAREVGPVLRASASDRDRLAGWTIDALVAVITRLDGQPAAPPAEVTHE